MGKCLIITTTNDLLRLQYDNIVYIASDGNYSQFLLSGGDMRMVTVQLGQIERLDTTLVADGVAQSVLSLG